MVTVAFHLEDSHRVGVLPSGLDGWRLLWKAYGITSFVIIDLTDDGYFGDMGDVSVSIDRYTALDDWIATLTTETVIGLETSDTITAAGVTPQPILTFTHPSECVYVFGPSMGFSSDEISDNSGWDWVYLPMAESTGIEARDAAALVAGHRYMTSLEG